MGQDPASWGFQLFFVALVKFSFVCTFSLFLFGHCTACQRLRDPSTTSLESSIPVYLSRVVTQKKKKRTESGLSASFKTMPTCGSLMVSTPLRGRQGRCSAGRQGRLTVSWPTGPT